MPALPLSDQAAGKPLGQPPPFRWEDKWPPSQFFPYGSLGLNSQLAAECKVISADRSRAVAGSRLIR